MPNPSPASARLRRTARFRDVRLQNRRDQNRCRILEEGRAKNEDAGNEKEIVGDRACNAEKKGVRRRGVRRRVVMESRIRRSQRSRGVE